MSTRKQQTFGIRLRSRDITHQQSRSALPPETRGVRGLTFLQPAHGLLETDVMPGSCAKSAGRCPVAREAAGPPSRLCAVNAPRSRRRTPIAPAESGESDDETSVSDLRVSSWQRRSSPCLFM
eukprot:SAG22_NODE_467_length_10171_cov_4.306295_16_plen_123_part_00